MATAARIPDARQATEQKNLYDRDYYTWARQQVDALKRHDFDAVDWENITEEIEALVRGEESSLRSQYARIIEHFLKLQYRGPRETEPVAGWRITVDNARTEIEQLLQDSPGLKGRRDAFFHQAWPRARKAAISSFVHPATERIRDDSAFLRENKRLKREWTRALPHENPYTRQQVEDPEWLPERVRLPQRPNTRQHPAPQH